MRCERVQRLQRPQPDRQWRQLPRRSPNRQRKISSPKTEWPPSPNSQRVPMLLPTVRPQRRHSMHSRRRPNPLAKGFRHLTKASDATSRSSRPKLICHPDRRERRDRSGRISDSFAKAKPVPVPNLLIQKPSAFLADNGGEIRPLGAGVTPAAPRAAENQQLVSPAKFNSSRFNRAGF
jgi:hypothetical protein